MRKVIQIAFGSSVLCALCDDGTVWHISHGGTWERMDDVPQDRPPQPPPPPDDLGDLDAMWSVSSIPPIYATRVSTAVMAQALAEGGFVIVEAPDPHSAKRIAEQSPGEGVTRRHFFGGRSLMFTYLTERFPF